ncbi:MAG: hypothetical protein HDS97_07225 [Bacteroidales bacterium]|nr:hypothetical protein [Bacteroidales bacterium]
MPNLTGNINRLLAEEIIPRSVAEFNKGMYNRDYSIFVNREYYRNVLLHFFSVSIVDEYLGNLRIEKGFPDFRQSWVIVNVVLPCTGAVGEADMVTIVINRSCSRTVAFSMERSFTNSFMACEWDGKNHYNNGTVANRKEFLATVIRLADEEFKRWGFNNTVNDQKREHEKERPKRNKTFASWKRNNKALYWLSLVILLCLIIVVVILVNTGKREHTDPVVHYDAQSGIDITSSPSSDSIIGASDSIAGEEYYGNPLIPEVYVESKNGKTIFHKNPECRLKGKNGFKTDLQEAAFMKYDPCQECVMSSIDFFDVYKDIIKQSEGITTYNEYGLSVDYRVKKIYEALKSEGGDVGTIEEFDKWFFRSGEEGYRNRKKVYEAFKADGADVGENYEEFVRWLDLKPAKKKEVYTSDNNNYSESYQEPERPVNIKTFKNGGMPFANWFGHGKYDKNSLSTLTISNQSDLDAVVILQSAKGVIRHCFINNHSS